MPNSILLSGPQGIGKSTFIYHIVNYILSKNEDKKYSTTNFEIDSDNLTGSWLEDVREKCKSKPF